MCIYMNYLLDIKTLAPFFCRLANPLLTRARKYFKTMIRVVIADDHSRVRQAWVFILSRNSEIEIVAECSNGVEAVEAVKNHQPDIVLMDINMHPMNGLEATKIITEDYPATRVIAMSVHADITYVRGMIKMGAIGYVTKNSSGTEMMKAIHLALQGQKYICTEVMRLVDFLE
jgi:two-component system, NarL family, invasion response regulator UvrY